MNIGKNFTAILLALASNISSANQTPTLDHDRSSISQVNALYAMFNADLKKLAPTTIEDYLGIRPTKKTMVNPKGETEIYYEYFSPSTPRFSLIFSAGYLTLEFSAPNVSVQATTAPEAPSPDCITASDFFNHLSSRWEVAADNSVLGYLSKNLESGKKHLFVEYYKNSKCLTQIMYWIKS